MNLAKIEREGKNKKRPKGGCMSQIILDRESILANMQVRFW
jgi:hypothetical protein